MNQIFITDWLKRVDIDYYQMFMGAWIPFNAWYMKEYFDFDNNIISDRNILSIIKTQDNPYKSRILDLIKPNSLPEAIEFKNNIWKLHNLLESYTIPNELNRISFSKMKLEDNKQKQFIKKYYSKFYKFEYLIQQPKTTKRFKCDIMNSNQVSEEIIELHACSIREIEQHPSYINKREEIKKIIKIGFNEINPNKPSSIVSESNKGIKISDQLYFIDNKDRVSQFIIEMLYLLRCKIFHGEIEPKHSYMGIYECAYNIQKELIKSLN
ncbi:hypothetical protein [uncultured Bacteroides sp.]|uniref:hypothetical protein n=1 Tax=uncultured Bacteroides sp. TaxID=162156 RepID=UPI002AAC41E5|nr:hypothetical protein [uncultured Bacteroides sp.]